MKWTVVRRKMVPYIRTKNRFRFNYKNLFYTKQQLKNFYGGLREYKLRNIFKKTWNSFSVFGLIITYIIWKTYIKSIYICSTMGPAIELDLTSFE